MDSFNALEYCKQDITDAAAYDYIAGHFSRLGFAPCFASVSVAVEGDGSRSDGIAICRRLDRKRWISFDGFNAESIRIIK